VKKLLITIFGLQVSTLGQIEDQIKARLQKGIGLSTKNRTNLKNSREVCANERT
jgi:hypothetical protein